MKKKGFTLIELLAVIVVLAIIALIATPIVMKLISNAQEGANARSVEGYMKAYEAAYYDYMLRNGGRKPSGTLELTSADYSGSKVNCENIAVNNGSFTATCSIDGQDGTYKYENGKATKVGNKTTENTVVCVPASGEDLIYTYAGTYDESTGSFPTLTGTYTTGNKEVGDAYRCTVGDNLSYVFNILEIGEDTISLLMNENISIDYIYWCSEHDDRCKDNDGNTTNKNGPISASEELTSKTSSWTNSKIINIELPTGQQIANAGGDENWNNGNKTGHVLPTWLYGNFGEYYDGYWTSDAYNGPFEYEYQENSGSWFVYKEGYLFVDGGPFGRGAIQGVRPVITISKDNIQ